MLPIGDYSYELRLHGEPVAFEHGRFDGGTITGLRRSANGLSRSQVRAVLDGERRIHFVSLSYSSNLFTRKASYRAMEDDFRGQVSAVAGRNEIVVKLGRFREVDAAGFVLFRALIIDHIRQRGVTRWTGRVAVIDPNTLVAASLKQNCASYDTRGRVWSYEPRMGDTEEIELDENGVITNRRDERGLTISRIIP
jgi:hypothetical protein